MSAIKMERVIHSLQLPPNVQDWILNREEFNNDTARYIYIDAIEGKPDNPLRAYLKELGEPVDYPDDKVLVYVSW